MFSCTVNQADRLLSQFQSSFPRAIVETKTHASLWNAISDVKSGAAFRVLSLLSQRRIFEKWRLFLFGIPLLFYCSAESKQ